MTVTTMTDSWDEERLVEAAKKGNLEAFNELILHYQNQVYNLAYHIMHDGPAADDATQQAFISAYRALRRFRGGSFRAWLLRIVTNACYDALRRRKLHPTVSWDDFGDLDEEANPHLVDESESPEAAVQREELSKFLDYTLASLSEPHRLVIVLVDRLGLSYEEAAQTMNIRVGTVKSRLYRARAEMRDLLLENRELLPARYRLKGKNV
ncbi:MAG: sigma-70 family RNA polymerase sigma factor [Anaerolineae bacterium]|nr:sigma-70 family RNA polymerase sigma factor [Anaerolineae bacterium]